MSRDNRSVDERGTDRINRRHVLRTASGVLLTGLGAGAVATAAASDAGSKEVTHLAPEDVGEVDSDETTVTPTSTNCYMEDWHNCSCPSIENGCTTSFYRRDCCIHNGERICTDWYCSDCCM